MNVPGCDHALVGMLPADQCLEAADLVVFEIDRRLIVQLELAFHQRPAQVELHAAPRLHLRVHLRLEEAVGAAAVALGAIERKIGVAQKLVGISPVRGTHGDADAGADDHLLAVDLVGLAQRIDDAQRQRGGVDRLRDRCLHDGEFVAAHARDRVGLADASPQPRGDHLEELVAGGMAQRIVDVLEEIEVEQMHGHDVVAFDARQRQLQPLVEQHAVGQAGQRVVQRHVRDLGLRAALLGDVLMGGDRAAVGHRLHRHRDVAPVVQ